MKKNIFISVGISAYNEEANIQALVKSLINQKQLGYKFVEIIVISDGSTDRTVELVKQIKDKRIKIVDHKDRAGQNRRQNELIDIMSNSSSALLILEADWLPANSRYLEHMVSAVPKHGNFSMITGNGVPSPEEKFWGNVMNTGFYYRRDIYTQAVKQSGLYMSYGGRLLSRSFLKSFRWSEDFHEDSYLFRKILESGIPRIAAKNATIYFKSVSTISDYFLQSGKYQKAKERESIKSNIYEFKINYIAFILVTLTHLVKQPILLPSYLFFSILSRMNSLFLPKYSIFWRPYQSSKSFSSRSARYTDTVKDCFSYHASDYSQAAFKRAGRQRLSEIETNYIRTHIGTSGIHVLDLGIGTGRNAHVLLNQKNSVTGLDISEKMLEQTQINLAKYYKTDKLRLKTADLNKKLPFRDNNFSGAICIRVIKYVKAWKSLLKEVNRVLKKNSIFIVEIANKNSVQSLSQNYNLFFTFDEKIFEEELTKSGFRVVNKEYGTKLPLFVYDVINSKTYVKILNLVENTLSNIFCGAFSRNILYTCIKK